LKLGQDLSELVASVLEPLLLESERKLLSFEQDTLDTLHKLPHTTCAHFIVGEPKDSFEHPYSQDVIDGASYLFEEDTLPSLVEGQQSIEGKASKGKGLWSWIINCLKKVFSLPLKLFAKKQQTMTMPPIVRFVVRKEAQEVQCDFLDQNKTAIEIPKNLEKNIEYLKKKIKELVSLRFYENEDFRQAFEPSSSKVVIVLNAGKEERAV